MTFMIHGYGSFSEGLTGRNHEDVEPAHVSLSSPKCRIFLMVFLSFISLFNEIFEALCRNVGSRTEY